MIVRTRELSEANPEWRWPTLAFAEDARYGRPRSMRRAFFLLLIVALVAFGWWRYQHLTNPGPSAFTPADRPRLDLKDLQILTALDEEYKRLAEAVVPSVVSIASSNPRGNEPLNPFELLLGNRQRAMRYSLGSGVIVSKEGHILTNNHVIVGMTKITVQLTDGRRLMQGQLSGCRAGPLASESFF